MKLIQLYIVIDSRIYSCMCVCVFNRVCPTGQAVSEGYESPMTVLVGVEPATPLLLRPKCLLLLLLC